MSCFVLGQDYHAKVVFDHIARYLFGTLGTRIGRPLHFIQVGANDGVYRDPIGKLILAQKWQGVLIEPIPAVFDRLRANDSEVRGPILENCAIGLSAGTATFYPSRKPHSPLSSFDKATVLSHRSWLPDIEGYIETMRVPIRTLEQLVATYSDGSNGFSLLVVDTEGRDAEAILSLGETSEWPPMI